MKELLKRTRWFFLLILLVSPLMLRGQETTRILFVGNSYTYFWNLPETVEAMAGFGDDGLDVEKSTAGGASLKDHWDGEKNLKSRERITNGQWDYVVLQNHSLSSIEHPDEFVEYGKKFIELVKQSGATPVLYATWARKHNPLMREHITEAYRNLGRETGTPVVFAGEAWEEVRILRPELDLYFPDGTHPSPAGSYLNACLFYSFFTGKPAIGLPPRVTMTRANGEEIFLNMMGNEDALFLQQLSDQLREDFMTVK